MAGEDRGRLIIIGGGIMGLGIGWRLAQAGWDVDLFERDRAGRSASWAAAGMLAARIQGGSAPRDPYTRFLRKCQELWPAFKDELEAFTGLDIGYRDEGTLIGAFTEDEAAEFRQMASSQPEDFVYLSPAEARAAEPALSSEIHGALLSLHDHHIDNRRYGHVLASAFTQAGGRLHESTEVTGLVIYGERVRGVRTHDDEYLARHVLLAAGAWSAEFAGAAVDAPIHPTKGQMLALQMDPDRPLVRHAVWGPGTYLVPRGTGRLIVGSTTEEAGFDDRVTAGGVLQLLAAARHTVPAIADLELAETWVGFRPTSADHMPIIGPSDREGLIVATGHGHNGILMSAGTIELVTRWLEGGQFDPILHPFQPRRFSVRG